MVINNEQRTQYIYCSIAGAMTSALIILLYFTMRINVTEKYKDDLKLFQKSLSYIKPSSLWEYNNSWTLIGKPSLKHEIYSAYFDTRTEIIDKIPEDKAKIAVGSVRVFAVLPIHFRDTITCIFRYEDFTMTQVRAQEANAMPEDHGEKFAAWVIMCPIRYYRDKLKRNAVHLPNMVALAIPSNPISQISPTFIQISYPRKMDNVLANPNPSLAVCVGPLQFSYSNVLRIAEFVEIYRILGVSHFYFYQRDASSDVVRLLRYYQSLKIVDILDWNLHNYNNIHYGGIVAQFNECVVRAMIVDNYRYAAVVDLDEIIIPLKHNSLTNFLRQCDEGRTSAFVFRNVFFYIKDSNDTFSVPQHTRNTMLYSQVKVKRAVEILPAYSRSKCIVNTRAVMEMGNHRIWRSVPGYADHTVPQAMGLLFHYRDKCINCKSLLMVDYTARRFGSLIWDRVDETCLHVFMESSGMCPTY